ncbi:MAG: hypothetical protein BTN85_1754 [Candidatus Methanohalarchaeum thermophilum]|uniref:Uncharacterized protein n=1 Tax=Methanohalarchaeum thermophilum TaxID=1903181 RepID=A0A1Q6DRW0_METT1|nr:MAG: hypothetical protein BTN85_1754 [Candidatus Methanohalarchaeum thermophilum]
MDDLILGIILSILAWLGLLIFVLHSKYVVEKIKKDEYNKGPFR